VTFSGVQRGVYEIRCVPFSVVRTCVGPEAPEIIAGLAEHLTDDVLTSREIAGLRLIAGGNANKEIGAQLSITEETVKGYVKNILAKLSANDRTHAVTIGLKRGIIEL
jgi:DNA-binding NarL/FixJ family response regulator